MVYTDVISSNWHKILPEKKKYTMHDANKVLTESLFNSKLNNGKTFTKNQARFITLCTAIFYDADVSRPLYKAI